MKFGFVLPLGDARTATELAVIAEDNNWDGFFVWEPVWGIDAWISLSACAMVTKNIKLGTMLSPISRMRPWKLASETATLDNLSNGRVILSVGLGGTDSGGWEEFGEITDRKVRAELMDEGLAILQGLWKGQPFNYSGKHYNIKEVNFYPPPNPVKKEIPIWVVGAWNWSKSMKRALKYNGILPYILDKNKNYRRVSLNNIREISEYVHQNRSGSNPFDIIVEGHTINDDSKSATYDQWEEAGATWWIEGLWDKMDDKNLKDILIKRLKKGP